MKKQFTIMSSMRTGSNLLVGILNQFDDILCHGEVFNPAFVGLDPRYLNILGYQRCDVKKWDADLDAFFKKMIQIPDRKLVGFKFFPGHGESMHKRILYNENIKKYFLGEIPYSPTFR